MLITSGFNDLIETYGYRSGESNDFNVSQTVSNENKK